ncbi:hypothetical protein B4098_0034 [Heyndrickxia coagulans]|jgi:ribulose-5-phosphate 4-epimerase/fuculose-1-phosphate aldolase|uniref:Uncharacterized protein n=1 Tax=Heyndrickxia coagulans TaxID=1398 RepID=A0A150K5N8_HEYCO|nr:hypothetical protein BCO26_1211 [Heyndrickxia coagulans 2-6]KYC59660.1 hypothetical protein B4098_0034 [Heyndrickxia coagulans]KYC64254.1 hypothetical protein B4099_3623 [Heyndrickxia coagulans]
MLTASRRFLPSFSTGLFCAAKAAWLKGINTNYDGNLSASLDNKNSHL